ncbi:hypothetical protein NKG94_34675 [Micromonospora sp. M12]
MAGTAEPRAARSPTAASRSPTRSARRTTRCTPPSGSTSPRTTGPTRTGTSRHPRRNSPAAWTPTPCSSRRPRRADRLPGRRAGRPASRAGRPGAGRRRHLHRRPPAQLQDDRDEGQPAVTAALRTRQPTGRVPWPLILIEGGEKSGKSWACAQFSTSKRIGQMYWLDLGEGSADEYGAIPGANYLVIEHDGTWAQIQGAVDAVKAEAARAADAGEPRSCSSSTR